MAFVGRTDLKDPGAAQHQWDRLARRRERLYAEDAQFREARPDDTVAESVRRPGLRIAEAMATVMTGYADRLALGQRSRDVITDPATGRASLNLLPRFDTISYRDLWSRIQAVAADWHHHDEHPLRAGDFVCVLGFASIDYTAAKLACVHLGAVVVPLQTSAPAAQHAPILSETQPRIMAVGIDYLSTAVEAVLEGFAPQRLVVFDYEPRSFYRGDGRPHYEGLPVDFLAAAIAAIGPHDGNGFTTYNTTNPHDDGISLDTFVDWIAEAGYPVQRIDDYADWVTRFETAMRALPENQRQRSVLAVLDIYRQPAEAVAGSPVHGGRFVAAVEKSGVRIPQLSKELICKYLTDLKMIGALEQ